MQRAVSSTRGILRAPYMSCPCYYHQMVRFQCVRASNVCRRSTRRDQQAEPCTRWRASSSSGSATSPSAWHPGRRPWRHRQRRTCHRSAAHRVLSATQLFDHVRRWCDRCLGLFDDIRRRVAWAPQRPTGGAARPGRATPCAGEWPLCCRVACRGAGRQAGGGGAWAWRLAAQPPNICRISSATAASASPDLPGRLRHGEVTRHGAAAAALSSRQYAGYGPRRPPATVV